MAEILFIPEIDETLSDLHEYDFDKELGELMARYTISPMAESDDPEPATNEGNDGQNPNPECPHGHSNQSQCTVCNSQNG